MRELIVMKKFIYKISFSNTHKVYIGQAADPDLRFRRHCQKLRDGIHHSKKLQLDYPDCGIPHIDIIDEASSRSDADIKEIHWINQYNSYIDGYNSTPGGSGTGVLHNSNAKHNTEDYQAVLCFLAYTDLTSQEIAQECDVKVGVVLRVSSQINHLWLKDLMPYEWNLMISKKRHHPNWKKYDSLMQSPTGEIYSVENAREFARQFNLCQSSLGKVLAGKQKQHKGWKVAENVSSK